MKIQDSVVFIIDDDEVDLMRYDRLLSKAGAKSVVEFNSSEAALQALLQDKKCDLIFLDYRMPRMDGRELLVRLKKQNDNGPKIVMLSGERDDEIEQDVLSLGASHYMTKRELTQESLNNLLEKLG